MPLPGEGAMAAFGRLLMALRIAIITVATSALMTRLALKPGSRNIAKRIKGDAALLSANTKMPTPKRAVSSKPKLSAPKLPRPVVMASA